MHKDNVLVRCIQSDIRYDHAELEQWLRTTRRAKRRMKLYHSKIRHGYTLRKINKDFYNGSAAAHKEEKKKRNKRRK